MASDKALRTELGGQAATEAEILKIVVDVNAIFANALKPNLKLIYMVIAPSLLLDCCFPFRQHWLIIYLSGPCRGTEHPSLKPRFRSGVGSSAALAL